MKPGARLASAVEILNEILNRHRPASQALSEWGRAHRFAGSGDRSAIGNLVYDALRRKLSLAARMNADTPRALTIAAAPRAFGYTPQEVIAAADGSQYALSKLSDAEAACLSRDDAEAWSADTPDHVRGDIPAWLAPYFERVFGAGLVEQGQGLAQRAPVDLRTNTLKADREKLLSALAKYGAEPTDLSPLCVRIPAPKSAARTPNVEADPAHGKGWFEVQDEGSQIAAALAGAGPRKQVLDLCAGAGGKTLALGAEMQNTGQIYAYDSDKHQLRPIFERLKRAGLRTAQVLDPGDQAALLALGPRFDVVFVDAPCTGSGVWRRRPDAKWRLKPANLTKRIAEQRTVLEMAHKMTNPGGRIVYVTCSVLAEENTDQVIWFLENHKEFSLVDFTKRWHETLGETALTSADGRTDTLLLTPANHATDGFFIATFERNAVSL